MKYICLLPSLLIIFFGCKNTIRIAHNGIEIEVIKEGHGEFAKPDQVIIANMMYKDSKDSVWSDTSEKGFPIFYLVSDTSNIKNEKSLESTFRSCKKGDSLRVKITSKSWFEDLQRRQLPPGVNPDEIFTFLFGIIDITSTVVADSIKQSIISMKQEEEQKQQAGQLAIDTLAIEKYLLDNNIKAEKDSSGVYYLITKVGAGPNPELSSKVKVSYKGMIMETGSTFDESQQPVEFDLRKLIPGWQIGFQKLQKGSKATLYIPSTLGYGATGFPPEIPSNSNLIFEVELISFM